MFITVNVVPFSIFEIYLSDFLITIIGRLPDTLMDDHKHKDDEHF